MFKSVICPGYIFDPARSTPFVEYVLRTLCTLYTLSSSQRSFSLCILYYLQKYCIVKNLHLNCFVSQ